MKIIPNDGLGKQLKEYRKIKGYTQMELVAKMYQYGSVLSESGYAKIEQGCRNIHMDDLAILKIILGFEYQSIFDGAEQKAHQKKETL